MYLCVILHASVFLLQDLSIVMTLSFGSKWYKIHIQSVCPAGVNWENSQQ
jgi:hypothetical protein